MGYIIFNNDIELSGRFEPKVTVFDVVYNSCQFQNVRQTLNC